MHNQTIASSPSSSSSSSSFKRFFLLLASTLVIAHLHQQEVEAKPLNVNQVKFRRLPPKEFSAALGSSITIECDAGASPPPSIYWLKNGKRIVQNELDENLVIDPASGLVGKSILVDDINRIALSSTRSRLFIDCASIADEATYTCVADNEYSQVSTHTKLTLIMPPVSPAAAAAAAASVSSNNNNENDLNSNDVAALGELAVAAATAAASGALKKTMDSNNNGNSDEAVAAAAVAAAAALTAMPQCLSERSRPQPARIHMWTHNIVEIMGNNVLLYCRSNIKQSQQQADLKLDGGSSSSSSSSSTGMSKRFTVTWTTPEGKLISDDQKDRYEMLETGDLLIKNLIWDDMGSYVCTVSDEQSSDTISSFVYPAQVRANSSNSSNGNSGKQATETTTTRKSGGSSLEQHQQNKWT